MISECNVSQREFQAMTGWSWGTVFSVLSGRVPTKKFKQDTARIVSGSPVMSAWMKRRNLICDDLFRPDPGPLKKDHRPAGFGKRMSKARLHPRMPLGSADPAKVQTHKETQMITHQALKHFKLFRSPFINDITDPKDIFFSQDHHFIKEMMLDTARHCGFTAVYGEVGSGKSVIRKAVFHELRNEEIKVIYPAILDNSRITASSLVDAIVMDISEEKPKRVLEQKSRQAVKLLRNRSMSGMKQVLIIEEAHQLNLAALKALKRIYELEDGFRRLIGIILIGQPELKHLLDETLDQGIREVARRVTQAEIGGLGDDLGRYLSHKFSRINRHADEIFNGDSFGAMQRRMQDKNGRKVVSKAYPLSVNNLAANAMNLAAETGEGKVSEEVVMAV
jgi:type II secretory pathway predicted ATPase ExeA